MGVPVLLWYATSVGSWSTVSGSATFTLVAGDALGIYFNSFTNSDPGNPTIAPGTLTRDAGSTFAFAGLAADSRLLYILSPGAGTYTVTAPAIAGGNDGEIYVFKIPGLSSPTVRTSNGRHDTGLPDPDARIFLISTPAAAKAGDIVIAARAHENSVALNPATVASPPGWTSLAKFTDGGVNLPTDLSYKVLSEDGIVQALFVTNDSAVTDTSGVIWVITGLAPTINTQPADQFVQDGAAATFSVAATASGGALSYQWQDDSSGSFADIASATSSSFTVIASRAINGRHYRVNVTDSNFTVTSATAALTVTLVQVAQLLGAPLDDDVTGTLGLLDPLGWGGIDLRVEKWVADELTVATTTAAALAASVVAQCAVTASLTSAIAPASDLAARVAVTPGLTTQITPAAAIVGQAAAAAALSTQITPASSSSAPVAVAGTLSTQIALAAAVSDQVAATGGLTTAIACAAAPASRATLTAGLSSSIAMASSVGCLATVAAAMASPAGVTADLQAKTAVSAALATSIACAAAASGSCAVTAALTTAVALSAPVSSSTALTAGLTTTVALGTACAGLATVSGLLASATTPLAAGASAWSTVTAALTTALALQASAQGVASVTGTVTSAAAASLATAAIGRARLQAALTSAIAMSAIVRASAGVSATADQPRGRAGEAPRAGPRRADGRPGLTRGSPATIRRT